MIYGGKAQLLCAILQHEIKLSVFSLGAFDESVVCFFRLINLVGGSSSSLGGGRSTSSMSIRLMIVYFLLKEVTVVGSIA